MLGDQYVTGLGECPPSVHIFHPITERDAPCWSPFLFDYCLIRRAQSVLYCFESR